MESTVSLTDIMQFKTSDIFIKMEQLLIILSEKVIYGEVFNWSIEIIRYHDLGKWLSHFLFSPDMPRLVSEKNFLLFREF